MSSCDVTYLNFQSNLCISRNQVCNNKADCTMGEDEKHCITLISQGYTVRLQQDGRPQKNAHGLVAYNSRGVWKPICAKSW